MIKYRIQELFDFQECKTYFVIQTNYYFETQTNYIERGWIFADTPRLETLNQAKRIVSIMKQYETPVYHYVDGEE